MTKTDSVKESHRKLIIDFIKIYGPSTADQIEAECAHLGHQNISPRVSELKQEGVLIDTGTKRKTRQKGMATVYRLARPDEKARPRPTFGQRVKELAAEYGWTKKQGCPIEHLRQTLEDAHGRNLSNMVSAFNTVPALFKETPTPRDEADEDSEDQTAYEEAVSELEDRDLGPGHRIQIYPSTLDQALDFLVAEAAQQAERSK